MAWTTEQKIKSLMRLPWTVLSEPAEDQGEFVVRVKEMDGLVVIGSQSEIEVEFWDALRTSIEARLEFEDSFELPPGVACLPWEAEPPRAGLRRVNVKRSVQERDSVTAFSQPVVFS